MFNQATLVGFVGKDPTIRALSSGDKVASFSLATSEHWRDKTTGEKRERTQWHYVVAFGPLVAVIESYVKKGSKLLVVGQIESRKYADQSGVERTVTEIVLRFGGQIKLLDGRRDEAPPNTDSRSSSSAARTAAEPAPFDDDIPF